MIQSRTSRFLSGVAAVGLGAGIVVATPVVVDLTTAPAWAQSQGGPPAGRGPAGAGGSGGAEDRGSDRGQRGPSADSDGTPHRGQPAPGERGGRPVWAGDGALPVVELGRLNVARAPSRVLEARYAELLSNWATIGATTMTLGGTIYTVAQLYSLPATQFATLLALYYDQITRIDSPLENLGLLRTIYLDPAAMLPGVTPASTNDLAAIPIASASDKTILPTADTVRALSIILGLNIAEADVPAITAGAQEVWAAIVAGHG